MGTAGQQTTARLLQDLEKRVLRGEKIIQKKGVGELEPAAKQKSLRVKHVPKKENPAAKKHVPVRARSKCPSGPVSVKAYTCLS